MQAGQAAPIPYDLSDMANDAVGLLDALGVGRAHVVGMSMGGAIAQLVAIDFPERVASLTLIASDSGNPDLPAVAAPEAFADVPAPPPSNEADAHIHYRVAVSKALAGAGYPVAEAARRAAAKRSLERFFDLEAAARQETV
jgi:pimeloyl-ACP methyl ester carboxylesterase